MNKTVSSVMDISEPWDNPHGGQVWYVTAFCTDGDVLSAGRKDEDAATELQGLLIEAIGVEQDFTLAPDRPTKSGKTKWKLLGFGTPGGAATYTAPGVQGNGGPQHHSGGTRSRSPEHDQFIQERMDRRTALMQVVEEARSFSVAASLERADAFYDWLRKTSEPASSAYETRVSPPSHPAGAGSETTSPAVRDTSKGGTEPPSAESPAAAGQEPTPAGDDRGGQSEGEAGCPPHDLDLDVAPKAMRYPCRKCNAWIKPTMAADEVEEMTT